MTPRRRLLHTLVVMSDQARAAARRQPHVDIAIAALLYGVMLLTMTAGPDRQPDVPGTLLAAVACGALVVRRRWPVPVLVISTLTVELFMARGRDYWSGLVLAAPLIALYTVAETTARRKALVGAGFMVLLLAGTHIGRPNGWMGAENLALAALGGLAVAAGDASRSRRAYLAEVEERARRAEDERDREAHRRVTDERLRIARDLHDVVGHHLALINVQAGVAAHVLDERPAQTRQSLAHIRQASKSALEELRETIGLLRDPEEPAAPTEPTVGLAGLDALIASFDRSGLRVERDISGSARPLSAAADLTAYRVIQESLTNVCKHGARPVARLRLRYRPDTLHIVVDNEGRPGAPEARAAGHGIVGMRERVAALGGSLEAGVRGGHGFRVSAVLPVTASAAPGAAGSGGAA
jgi:signal transduction histidine kinase